MTFPDSRAAALDRLEAFLPQAGRAYAARRNQHGDAAAPTTSRLSPAIRRRLIAEDEVAARVIGAHGAVAAEKFLQELCWRSYWVGWLQQRPAIWRHWQVDTKRLAESTDSGLQNRLATALAGQTGIDCFDAWVAELAATGWLHNHARMNFASIWIFTLGLPWQLGADLFWRQLIDACPASNTLSWRWVAGLQTAGKTYLANPETIRNMSGGRFRVDAALARVAAPVAGDDIPAPCPIAPAGRVDATARTGLYLTSADLSLETLTLPALVAIAAPTRLSADLSEVRRRYGDAAIADGLARAEARTGIAPDRIYAGQAVEALRDWATRHRLQQVITANAPVGPVADRLDRFETALAGDGVRLVRLRRARDDTAWPAASRGFFAFKAVIPRLLALRVGALA